MQKIIRPIDVLQEEATEDIEKMAAVIDVYKRQNRA